MRRFLLRFRGVHDTFHRSELSANAVALGVPLEYGEALGLPSDESNLLRWVSTYSLEDMLDICERSVLIRSAMHVVALYDTVADKIVLHDPVIPAPPPFTFKIEFDAARIQHRSWPGAEKQKWFDLFVPLIPVEPEERVVNLTDPDFVFRIGMSLDQRFVFFGLELAQGAHQNDCTKFNLKDRTYIYTTSMDPELSSLMAVFGRCGPGSLVWDPFVGSGSVLIGAAAYGSTTFGSDADKLMLPRIHENFAQYGLGSLWAGCFHASVDEPLCLNSPDDGAGVVDAIVTDPPYGKRVSIKKFEKKSTGTDQDATGSEDDEDDGDDDDDDDDDTLLFDEHPGHPKFIRRMKRREELERVISNLYGLAARTVRLGGMLVYWMPTSENYTKADLMLHRCFRIVANCDQSLSGPNRRRLVACQKVRTLGELTEEEQSSPMVSVSEVWRDGRFVDTDVANEDQREMERLASCREARKRYKRAKHEKLVRALEYIKIHDPERFAQGPGRRQKQPKRKLPDNFKRDVVRPANGSRGEQS